MFTAPTRHIGSGFRWFCLALSICGQERTIVRNIQNDFISGFGCTRVEANFC